MRDYDPTMGRYLQADPLGLIDGASVYGYARQSPLRWTDPTGENPLLIGLLAGLVLDRAVQIGLEYCACEDEFVLPNVPVWTLYGDAGLFGGFEPKYRGLAGGGPSGQWSSMWSRLYGSGYQDPAGRARREFGRSVAKRLWWAWVPIFVYDAARLGECIYQWNSRRDDVDVVP